MKMSEIVKELASQINLPVITISLPTVSIRDMFAPRVLTNHERWLLDEWFADRVAKYPEARSSVRDLYDDSLEGFMKRQAKEDVNITEDDMARYLTSKGYHSKRICGRLHFEGIRNIIGGSVCSGNYMT